MLNHNNCKIPQTPQKNSPYTMSINRHKLWYRAQHIQLNTHVVCFLQ